MATRRALQHARRRMDRASMELTFPGGTGRYVERWQAYADEAARLQADPARPWQDAQVYEIDLRLPSLTEPARVFDFWRLVVSLHHERYPAHIGWPTFVSRPVPFNPHVAPDSGVLCTGTLWNPSTTLADFVVRVLRVLNLDEVLPMAEHGLNPAATLHWRTVLRSRPLDPGVTYPVVQRPQTEAQGVVASPFGTVQVLRGAR